MWQTSIASSLPHVEGITCSVREDIYWLAYSNLPDSQAIPLEERWAQKGDALRTITLPVPEHGEPQMLLCVQLAGEWLGAKTSAWWRETWIFLSK